MFAILGAVALYKSPEAPHQWAMVAICALMIAILATDLKKPKKG